MIYRVFNKKDVYQQSYCVSLQDSLEWAINCAEKTNGRVEKVYDKDGEEVSEIVFSVKK